MRFIGLDKSYILRNSVLFLYEGKKYYRYSLGNPVSVLTPKSMHKNIVVVKNLASKVTEDNLMIKYEPSSNIYFSEKLLTSDLDKNSVSISFNDKLSSLFIGTPDEFELVGGVITFSGWLSANGMVEKDRKVYGNIYTYDNLKTKCRVLGIGVRKDMIFGILYIPNTRGVLLGERDNDFFGITTTTFKERLIYESKGFTIKDWFEGAKIKEIKE